MFFAVCYFPPFSTSWLHNVPPPAKRKSIRHEIAACKPENVTHQRIWYRFLVLFFLFRFRFYRRRNELAQFFFAERRRWRREDRFPARSLVQRNVVALGRPMSARETGPTPRTASTHQQIFFSSLSRLALLFGPVIFYRLFKRFFSSSLFLVRLRRRRRCRVRHGTQLD